MSGEYRVQITVKNNLLASAIEACGFASVPKFCDANGLAYGTVNGFLSLKIPPLTGEGEFCRQAKMLMEVLGAAPSDLWTDEQLTLRLSSNRASTTVGRAELDALLEWRGEATRTLEDAYDIKAIGRVMEEAFDKARMTKREVFVLRSRFNDEKTLDEVGASLNVTRERIRQIEKQAIRKLCNPDAQRVFASAGIVGEQG